MRVTSAVLAALLACPALADVGDQLFKLLPDDGAEADFFGGSVAISGVPALVGAYLHNDNGDDSGSACLFDICDPVPAFSG